MRILALAGEKVCQRFLFYLYQSSKNVPRHILYYAHIKRSQPNELCCDHPVIPQKDIMLLRRMTIV